MKLAPIVLFVYNRLWHTRRVIDALSLCNLSLNSNLIIYADGAKSERDLVEVEKVRSFIRSISGFKSVEIIERSSNFGLAGNIVSGLDQVFLRYETAVVLEDDVLVEVNYLEVMNELLNRYAKAENVGSISGYTYPIILGDNTPDFFLLPRASSWGWATWKNRWSGIDWEVSDLEDFVLSPNSQKEFNRGGGDLTAMLFKWKLGMNNSWAIRWCYHHYKKGLYSVFPKYNMVENIGNDGSGTHSPKTKKYRANLISPSKLRYPVKLEVDPSALSSLGQFFKPSLYRKVINLLMLRKAKLLR